MSEATHTSTSMINLTIPTTPYQDMDGKDNNLQDLENTFDSFQITFDPINHPNPHVSERSFSLLGVIGGCVLLLLFLAFITCVNVRHMNLYQVALLIIRQQSPFLHFRDILEKISKTEECITSCSNSTMYSGAMFT